MKNILIKKDKFDNLWYLKMPDWKKLKFQNEKEFEKVLLLIKKWWEQMFRWIKIRDWYFFWKWVSDFIIRFMDWKFEIFNLLDIKSKWK